MFHTNISKYTNGYNSIVLIKTTQNNVHTLGNLALMKQQTDWGGGGPTYMPTINLKTIKIITPFKN